MLGKYKLLPLTGLAICVTGLSLEVRESLKQCCLQHGSTYSTDLTRKVTHLITDMPRNQLEIDADLNSLPLKIQYARKWNIPILHLDWLHKTIQNGYLADSFEFSIFKASNGAIIMDSSIAALTPIITPVSLECENINFLFKGLYFSVSPKLWGMRNEIIRVIEDHGGIVNWHFSHKHATHYVYSSAKPIPSAISVKASSLQLKRYAISTNDWSDICQAQALKIPIISHYWLFESVKTKRKLPEVEYQSHFQPSRTRLEMISPVLTAQMHLLPASSGSVIDSEESSQKTDSQLSTFIDNLVASNLIHSDKTQPHSQSTSTVDSNTTRDHDIIKLTKQKFREKSTCQPSLDSRANSLLKENILNTSNIIKTPFELDPNFLTSPQIKVSYETEFLSQANNEKELLFKKIRSPSRDRPDAEVMNKKTRKSTRK